MVDTPDPAAAPAAPEPAAAAPASAPAPAAAEPAAAPVRPEGLPDDLWEDGKGVKVGDLWSKARDTEAERDALKAAVGEKPADANGYDFALPDDFKAPEGFKVELDPKDPSLVAAREAAFAAGMTAPAWKAALGVFANQQVAAQRAAVETYVAEKTKLGDNAGARMTAVEQWLGANLPTDEAQALARMTSTAAGVKAVERIMAMRGPAAGPGGKAATTNFEGKSGRSRLEAIHSRAA